MQSRPLVARVAGEVYLDDSAGTAVSESGAVPVDYVSFGGPGQSGERMALLQKREHRVLGRYLLGEPIAAGGMATVHLGRLVGAAGFSRTVAIKRLHGHLARNHGLVQRFVDEARIVSRIRHANVVQTLDIVADDGELLLVLDYVHGESLAKLRRESLARGMPVPAAVASAIVVGVLRGLHAAHEAKSANGTPLGCVHRDVSPQNILVGADGVARVLDFGIAKAAGRLAESLTRNVKCKLAYMSPQQVGGEELDRRADIFAAGVVLWEALAGERLFRGEDAATTIHAVYHRTPPALSERGLGIAPAADAVLSRALAKTLEERFESADAMARALEIAIPPAHEREVADWVDRVGRDALAERAAKVSAFERVALGDTDEAAAGSFERHPLPLRTLRPATKTSVDLDQTFQPPARQRRRDALVPPPMPDASPALALLPTPPHATSDDASDDTDRELVPPVSIEEASGARRCTLPVQGPSSLVRTRVAETRPTSHTEPVPPAYPTPLVMMVAPSPSRAIPFVSEPPGTRSHVVPAPASTRPALVRLALLVVVPPAVVAAALFGLRIHGPRAHAAHGREGAPPATMMVAAGPPPAIATEAAPPAPPVAPPPIAAPIEPSATVTPPSPAKRAGVRPPPPKKPSKPPTKASLIGGIPRDRSDRR
ncbi:MAG: serine/threonine protein kinase [Deltaproteobacteria bacterium]|nr:serine/threonine protein kinase [Deltaproteobacteria bacterium]